MKSLLAIAASLAACVALWLAVEGNHNSLYAQVVDAARKARTIHIIHYEQRKEETEPIKTWESWYESGVGFAREVWDWKHTAFRQCIFGNEDSTWTLDNDQKQTAIRSRGRGITKETEQIFSDIEPPRPGVAEPWPKLSGRRSGVRRTAVQSILVENRQTTAIVLSRSTIATCPGGKPRARGRPLEYHTV